MKMKLSRSIISILSICLLKDDRERRDTPIHIWLCDRKTQTRYHAAEIPTSTLKFISNWAVERSEPNNNTNPSHQDLLLPVRTLDHVEDIEVRGLNLLFELHLHHTEIGAHYTHGSIARRILIYRALQLLSLHEQAEDLRSAIMQSLRTTPVTELDVQTIWWAFDRAPEEHAWRDAVLRNLAHFGVLERQEQPEGGLILHFLENELVQMDDMERDAFVRLYRFHKAAVQDLRWVGVMKAWGKIKGGVYV